MSLTQLPVKDVTKQHLELLDTVPAFIFYLDDQMRYRIVNKAFIDWFGVKKDEVIGSTIEEFVGPAAWKIIQPHIQQAYRGKKSDCEMEFTYQNDTTKWVHAIYTPQINEEGKVAGIIAMATDITEKKYSEIALRENEEKNRLFIEYAPVAMAMFDRQMRYISVSKQWMKEYDLEGNIIGKNHYELFPNILQRWKDVHSRCMQGAIERSDEDFYVKDNGTSVWLKWKVYPWYNASNEIGGIVIFTENITERKNAEETIKASEERFRTMANESPLFVWETDEKLQTTFLNKEGFRYFNLDEKMKMADLSWKKFIHPDDLPTVLKIMSQAAKEHISYTMEMRLRNGTTNEYHWFLDKGAPKYSAGKFIGFIGTSLDIHDRKMTEKGLEEKINQHTSELHTTNLELLKQNKFVETVINSSQEWMAVWDKDMRLTLINEAALKAMSKRKEEVIGKTLLEILPDAKNTKTENDLKRVMQGEYIENDPFYSLVGKWIKNYIIPLKDDDGNVYAAYAVAQDVTSVVESQLALQKSQKHFAQLFNLSPVAKLITRASDGKIIDVNPAWEELFGKKRSDVLGKTSVEIGLVSKAVRNQKLKEFESIGGNISDAELQLEINGETVYMLTSIVSIELDEVKCYLGAMVDITDRKDEEEKRKQMAMELAVKNKELQDTIKLLHSQELKDEQKNNFIAMASHELKTPITSIKGYVQILVNAFEKEKDGEKKSLPPLMVRSSLMSIDKQVNRLTRLISELLDISKIETGKLKLNKEVFSLNALIIDLIQDILHTSPKHHINVFHDLECSVFADKDRIGQVIINLLTNAIKYSPSSEKIDVWIRKADNNYVAVSVKDYGIGIDKAEQDKIFERFYRVKGRQEQTYPGFGIGLYIAKDIIEKHDGLITVESESNRGATFTFTLPVKK